MLEGLRGQAVAELCTEPQISPSRYAQWRDQFWAQAARAFAVHQHNRREVHLEQENATLKQLVGELLLERKNSDAGWG